jgi:hypothetical protein
VACGGPPQGVDGIWSPSRIDALQLWFEDRHGEAKQNSIGMFREDAERMHETLKGLDVSAFLFAAAACSGGSTTTSPSPLPKPAPTPPVTQTFHLTGIVTDDEGNRVPNARFSVEFPAQV